MPIDDCRKWGLLWCVKMREDGSKKEHLIWEDRKPLIFHTQQEARAYAAAKYGYIKTRADLRQAPHGWRCPMPVKIVGIQWER